VPESPFPLTVDRVLSGRYRLLLLIARGGMAEVWEGVDEVLARPVAVKVLHAHLAEDEGFVERFRREGVAAARLADPGIVATYDAGMDDGVAYLVMELVRGRTLREALEREGPFSPAEAGHVGAAVAGALHHAHRAGLVHRDVKPANILLAEDGRVRVADFGIAKLGGGGGDLTQTGALIGTAKYLSPEQVEGRSPDARSDVYALGVVLYEMLCGRPPFAAETELATALQHVRAEASPPRQLKAGIPPSLEAVVLRAMARDPAQRYQSAADLRGALRAVDLGPDDAVPFVIREPTPPAGVAPLPRPARRSWAPLAAVFVVVGLSLAGAVALLSGDDSPRRSPSSPGSAASHAVPIVAAHSFDPEGDGEENDAKAGLAVDGDQATSWPTDRYNSRQFGNLKKGVGLVLDAGRAQRLSRLEVTSPTSGWAASIYLSPQPGRSLADWGQPVASRRGITGAAAFDLRGRAARYVLVWITDPGTDAKAEIAEATLRS
jgi:serine/threonine-protein kinase